MQYMGFASYAAGECIFKQGDTGEHFYIILSGAVAVSVYTDEETKVRHMWASHSLIIADPNHRFLECLATTPALIQAMSDLELANDMLFNVLCCCQTDNNTCRKRKLLLTC